MTSSESFEEAVKDEFKKWWDAQPWWCPICGAGDGKYGDMLPPVDHECGIPVINHEGIFLPSKD